MVAPRRIYSLWQNALTALSSVLSVIIAVVIYHELSEAPGGWWVRGLGTLILVTWSGLSASLVVRSVRLGLYRDGDGRMTIRSLLRTWTIQVDQVRDVQRFEIAGSFGSKSYLPVIVADEPDQRRSIFLWWLSAMTESRAQDYSARIRALMAAAEGDVTPGGGRD
jgi:hypothetical protein